MTNWEQLWLLALVLAVCLPIILLVRGGRHPPAQPARAPGVALAAPSAGKAPEPLPPELRIDPAQLEVIRDNTLDRPEEHAVFLRLLTILKRATPEQLQRAALGRITYAQLQRQPNQYRGKLVTIQGAVRRVSAAQAPKNDLGIDRYYQLWVQPADAPAWPIVVECLDLPRGFPAGPEVSEEAEITGFFFKRWAYIAQDQPRTAPTLLARTIQWEKPIQPASQPAPMQWSSALIVVAGAMAILAWIVWRRRGGPPAHRTQPGEVEPNFAALEDPPSREADHNP